MTALNALTKRLDFAIDCAERDGLQEPLLAAAVALRDFAITFAQQDVLAGTAPSAKTESAPSAEPDEPMFVLLGRDPAAWACVTVWVKLRQLLGDTDEDKIEEARKCARAMEAWARAKGKNTEQAHAAFVTTIAEARSDMMPLPSWTTIARLVLAKLSGGVSLESGAKSG